MEISNEADYTSYGGNKNHRNRGETLVKYIGTESLTLTTGQYYTYKQLAVGTGVKPKTIQTRVLMGDGYFADDTTVRPKSVTYGTPTSGGSKKHREASLLILRCSSAVETVSSKWLSLGLTAIDPNYTNRQWR